MTDISTNNWDVVSITDFDTLNKIINSTQDGKAYPETFNGQDEDGDDGLTVSMSGSWGDWTVTSDASGAKVNKNCCSECVFLLQLKLLIYLSLSSPWYFLVYEILFLIVLISTKQNPRTKIPITNLSSIIITREMRISEQNREFSNHRAMHTENSPIKGKIHLKLVVNVLFIDLLPEPQHDTFF
jgi:hypothetical protein